MIDVEMSLCWMIFHDLSIHTFATSCEIRALVPWRFGGIIVLEILILISNLDKVIVLAFGYRASVDGFRHNGRQTTKTGSQTRSDLFDVHGRSRHF